MTDKTITKQDGDEDVCAMYENMIKKKPPQNDGEWKTMCDEMTKRGASKCKESPTFSPHCSTDSGKKAGAEHFSMMNDNKSMNSILVFGLFIVLFLFVYMYGFHGILKFEKNLNYLIAILFSAFGIILSIMLIIGAIRHVSSSTMSDEEKTNNRNGLLVMLVLIIFFSMMAIIRYNYGKLFNALK